MIKSTSVFFSFVLSSVLALAFEAETENWVQWRGPTADGVAGDGARPPLHWDRNSNALWIANLPGEGTATPIVFDDQIFVLSAEKTSRRSPKPVLNDVNAKTVPDEFFYRFIVTSIDRNTGAERWQRIATEQVPHEGRHATNTYAAGSPTTDGERLYVSFGSRGTFCYTLNGELIWQVDLGQMRTRFGWGEAITPVLVDDLLIINWDQEIGSYITALDKRTGKMVWKVDRPGEVTSWNTPLITSIDDKQIVIVNGTGSAKAYEAKTGDLLWECGGQTTNAIPSPIRFEDTAICMSGYRGACGCAIPLNSIGDVTDKGLVRWKVSQGTPYVPSPIISGQKLLFTAGNTDVLSCLDVRTGKSLMERKRLSGVDSLYASPMVANGHIYFAGRLGTTVVVKDNENLDIVAVNELEDAIDASPVAVNDQLILRSWTKLYCFQDAPIAARPDTSKAARTLPPVETRLIAKGFNLEQASETSANASLGDLDGDGDLDIVLAKGRHWPLHDRVLLNDGTAQFPVTYNLSDSPDRTYSAVLADIDCDGDLDVLVSNDSPDRKLVYLNDGKAHFTISGTWGSPNWNTRNAAVSDLNGDHYPDLIAANRRSPSFACLNDGRGNFKDSDCIEIRSESASTIVPADFDNDGFVDLAIPHRDAGQSKVFYNDGKAGFTRTSVFGSAKSSSRAAAFGDLNGDGWNDLIVGDERVGLFVYLNNEKGGLTEGKPFGEKSLVPYAISVSDMNSDHHLDIVVGYASGPGSIFLNDGTGVAFAQVRFGDGNGAVYGLAVDDLNGDGKPDIVAARSEAPNVLYLLFAGSDLVFGID